MIDTHIHIEMFWLYQKKSKYTSIVNEKGIEEAIRELKWANVEKCIACYITYEKFKEFQAKAKENGIEVLGCQWISLNESLPETLDYQIDKTVIGVKCHNKRNFRTTGKNPIINYQDSKVFKELLERGVPYVQLHTEDGKGTCRPSDLIDLFAKYPKTIFHICHSGCGPYRHWKPSNYLSPCYKSYALFIGLIHEMFAILEEYPNVWSDCSINGPAALPTVYGMDKFPEHLVFATDYTPFMVQTTGVWGFCNYPYLKDNTEKYWKLITSLSAY